MEKVIFKKGKIIENKAERMTYPGNKMEYRQSLTIRTNLFKKYTCTWSANDENNLFGIGEKVGLWIVQGEDQNGIAKIKSLI